MYSPNDRTLIELTGKDRVKFLHGMTTADVKGLNPRTGTIAAMVEIKGKLLAELIIYAQPNSLFIETDLTTSEIVMKTLAKYKVTDDVQIVDRSNVARKWVMIGAPHHFPSHICVAELTVPVAPTFHSWIYKGEYDHGLKSISPQEWETLRIEAGIPKFGVDIGPENLPLESSYLEKGISYTKGCYIGQETITRVAHRGGHIAHRLMGVTSEKEIPLGSLLLREGKEVGKVTSSTYSPKLQRYLGLALIHRDAFAPGTTVQIRGAEPQLGMVDSLNFN